MAEQLQVAIRAVNEATAALKSIQGDIDNVGNSAQTSGEKAGGFGEKLKSIFEIGTGVAAGLGLAGAIGGVAESIKGAVEEANEYSLIQAQTDTVTKNLGGTTGVTAEQIRSLAESFSQTTPYSKEMVQSAENMFGTFSNISSTVLPGATQAALDVAAGMKAAGKSMDLSQITTSLGRALQDPAKGMTTLSREGIVFTAQQQKVVQSMEDSGNMAGAQKYILDALEKSYGGAATAAGDTLGGKIDILKNNFHDMTMTLVSEVMPSAVRLSDWIVTKALPAFTQFTEWVSEKAVPALQKIAKSDAAPTFERIAGAVQKAVPYVKDLATDAQSLMKWLGGFGPVAAAVAGFATAIVVIPALIDAWAAAQKVLNTVQAIFDAEAEANPIGLIVTAIAALVAGIILLVMNWKKLEEEFPILKTITDDVRGALEAFGGFLTGTLIPAIGSVVSYIQENWGTIGPIITGIFDGAKQYIQGVWTQISGIIQGAAQVIQGIFDIIDGLLHGDWSQAWQGLQEVIGGVWTAIKGIVSGAVQELGGILNMATGGKLGQIVSGVIDGLGTFGTTVEQFFKDLPGKIVSALGDMYTQFFNIGEEIIRGIGDGIENMVGSLLDKAKGVASSVGSALNPKNWIGSPMGVQNWFPYYFNLAMDNLQKASESSSVPANVAASVAKPILDALKSMQMAAAAMRTTSSMTPAQIAALTVNNVSGSSFEGGIDAYALQASKAYATAGNVLQNIQGNGTINPFLNPDGSANFAAIYGQPNAQGGFTGPGAQFAGLSAAALATNPAYQQFLASGGVPVLGNGGIVSRPTLAIVGDSGPEAVVPLTRGNRSMLGSIAPTVIMHFHGPTTSKELRAAMDDWLKHQLGYGAAQHGVV